MCSHLPFDAVGGGSASYLVQVESATPLYVKYFLRS